MDVFEALDQRSHLLCSLTNQIRWRQVIVIKQRRLDTGKSYVKWSNTIKKGVYWGSMIYSIPYLSTHSSISLIISKKHKFYFCRCVKHTGEGFYGKWNYLNNRLIILSAPLAFDFIDGQRLQYLLQKRNLRFGGPSHRLHHIYLCRQGLFWPSDRDPHWPSCSFKRVTFSLI